MPVIGLLLIAVLPILYGVFISALFKNKESKWSTLYASGFIAMILALLVSILVALKLDADLRRDVHVLHFFRFENLEHDVEYVLMSFFYLIKKYN